MPGLVRFWSVMRVLGMGKVCVCEGPVWALGVVWEACLPLSISPRSLRSTTWFEYSWTRVALVCLKCRSRGVDVKNVII